MLWVEIPVRNEPVIYRAKKCMGLVPREQRKKIYKFANKAQALAIFNQGLVAVCEKYLKKGSKIYLEGQIETRSYEQDGIKRYVTEIVLRPFRGELTMLDNKPQENAPAAPAEGAGAPPAPLADQFNDPTDEIPF